MVDMDFKDTEEGGAPGKRSFPSILIIFFLLVVVGVGAFYAGKLLSGGENSNTSTQAGDQKGIRDSGDKTGDTTGQGNRKTGSTGNTQQGTGGTAGMEKGDPGFLPLDTFTVNLNDPFGRRYVECVLNLVLDDKSLVPKIKGNELVMAKIRHEIFMTISAKSYDELKSTAGKITLFEEIQMRVNEALKEKLGVEPVLEVLQTKFLMQ